MDRLTKLVLVSLLLMPLQASAAEPVTITWELATGLHRVGDIVPLRVKLNSQGQLINALDLPIRFSTVGLEITSLEQNLTNFPLWPDAPSWDNTKGQLHFSAGRPHGLIAAGATVATVNVKLRAGGLWSFTVGDRARAYLNDGDATALTVQSAPIDIQVADALVPREMIASPSHPNEDEWSTKNDVDLRWEYDPTRQYSFSWGQDPIQAPDDVPDQVNGQQQFADVGDGLWWFGLKSRGSDGLWGPIARRVVRVDRQAPAAFTIMQLPSSSVGGATVIAWNASDAVSGVADSHLRIGNQGVAVVTSPLTIKPEWYGRRLTIVVTDRAGNQTSASWDGPQSRTAWQSIIRSGAWPLIGVAMILLLFRLTIWRRWRA